jgi:DNA-directed RNA polymerase subunit omega
MIYPSMASLLKKVDSRYTLVMLASKRARMLTEGAQKLTSVNSSKDVTIAINEISEGKVGYHRLGKPGGEEETVFITESVTTPRPAWESKRLGEEDEGEWVEEEMLDEEHETEEDAQDADEDDDQ